MRTPTSGWYAWLVLAMVGFIVYGSWVPFDFTARSWAEVVEAFHWSLTERLWPASRSDWIANVMLGVPLGYFLLGTARLDRPEGWGTSFAMVLLLPCCIALALMVEFGQLYLPTRTCAGSDVLAQGLGAIVGMIGWREFGQGLTDRLRRGLADPDAGGLAIKVLGGYLGLLGLLLFLPLDLTLSPADVYRKLRDHAVLIPGGEFLARNPVEHWRLIQREVEVVGLYLPVGLLVARIPSSLAKSWKRSPIWWGLLIPGVLESGQFFVQSRVPSSTDALVGTVAVAVGWALGQWFSRGISLSASLTLGLLWFALQAMAAWHPFDFCIQSDLGSFGLVPFLNFVEVNYLAAFDQFLTRAINLAPFGILFAASTDPGTRGPIARTMLAGLVGGILAFILEAGQLLLPTRTAHISDLLLGAIGAGSAVILTDWLRSSATRGASGSGEAILLVAAPARWRYTA